MKRKDDFILQNVGGEYLLVPLGPRVVDLNGIITLNVTGRRIWELLAEHRSVDDLTADIGEHFDVDCDRARTDIKIFLDEISLMGLLEE
jgi:hypothetical protein